MHCSWLMVNRPKCGRSCKGEFCGRHNQQLKKGMNQPPACKKCEIRGTRSVNEICKVCGSDWRIYNRRAVFKRHMKKVYNDVLLNFWKRQFHI